MPVLNEPTIQNRDDLDRVLKDITLGASGILPKRWEWGVWPKVGGWELGFVFWAPDSAGEFDAPVQKISLGGIWLQPGTRVSSVIRTARLVVELALRHELEEAFAYQGRRILDPHMPLEEFVRAPRA